MWGRRGGFFYETTAGSGSGVLDDIPGNNYGDNSGGANCNWLFCLSVETVSECPEGFSGDDLSIAFLNFSDSETGSWNASASPCPNDPNFLFKVALACCAPPDLTPVNPTCANPNGGSITAVAVGEPPFTFVWSNGFTEENVTTLSISNLPAGFYSVTTTDNTGCVAAASISLEEETTGSAINIAVSIEGCGGCQASPNAPLNIQIQASDGTLLPDFFPVTGCPSNITVCLNEALSYNLLYGGQVISNVVVGGVVTDDLFTFITDTEADAGTMSDDTQILCDGDFTNATTIGAQLSDGQVLAYVLHTSPTNIAGTILATNTTGGSFSVNSGAGIQPNQTYYVSAIAGPEGGIAGIPDLTSPCTDVAEGMPVVFLAPVSFLINEYCDWMTGIYYITAQPTGGLPEYDASTLYNVIGTNINGTFGAGQSFALEIPEGEAQFYDFAAQDELGCQGSVSADFICLKTPIELQVFSGRVETEGNFLFWLTATEANSHHFTLQRSTDGINFQTIATVAAAGNSTTTRQYEWLDKTALAGLSYYRLLQTDADGNGMQAPNIVTLRRETALSGLTINFVALQDETLQLSYTTSASEEVEVKIYNMAGQLLYNQPQSAAVGVNTVSVNANRFSAGVYLVVLQNQTEQVTTKWMQY